MKPDGVSDNIIKDLTDALDKAIMQSMQNIVQYTMELERYISIIVIYIFKGVYNMTVKLGKHELLLKQKPEVYINTERGYMSIVIILEDKEGKLYDLKARIDYKNKHCSVELLKKNANIKECFK